MNTLKHITVGLTIIICCILLHEQMTHKTHQLNTDLLTINNNIQKYQTQIKILKADLGNA